MTHAQTARRKRRFLEALGKFGNVTTAAEQSDVPRRTVYQWQEIDDQFAAAFREAELKATEVLEAEARRRAVDGVKHNRRVFDSRGNLVDEYTEIKYSDTLLIFLLKARAPDKYRERVQLQHADSEGGRLDLATLMQRAREYRDAERAG